jgi:glycosyltransferase involved in cell wall biosynthesis
MTTDAVGGIWTYATSLALMLCRRGYQVTLVTMGPSPRVEQIEAIADAPGLIIETTDLALEWMDPDGADLSRARDVLRRVAERASANIIHLNSFREATFGFAAPVLVVAHSCVASWWRACRQDRAIDPSWQLYLRNVAAGLDAADACAAPTATYRNWIEASYQPRRCGHAIWNGIALPGVRTRKQPFIFAAGRLWDEAKNVALLSKIAPALDWPVRVAGATQPAGGLARASSASEAVLQLGVLPHPEVICQMRAASIFVSPAVYEPFGLTVLEAAACGCALVLSDIPTFRELWDGVALFFDSRDPASLMQALQSASRNDALRSLLQQAARERACRFSLDAAVKDYRCLYRAMQVSPHTDSAARVPVFAEVHA